MVATRPGAPLDSGLQLLTSTEPSIYPSMAFAKRGPRGRGEFLQKVVLALGMQGPRIEVDSSSNLDVHNRILNEKQDKAREK